MRSHSATSYYSQIFKSNSLRKLAIGLLIFSGFSMSFYFYSQLKSMTNSRNQLRSLLEKRELEIERLSIHKTYENKIDNSLDQLPTCLKKSKNHYFNDNELINSIINTNTNKEEETSKRCIFRTKYVLAIKSGGKGSFERRQLLRRTWISQLPSDAIHFFFLTRNQEDPDLESELQKVCF